jgi:hypothetical protein
MKEKTLDEAWNEFVIVFCESLKIDKLLDWLVRKLKKYENILR